MATMHHIVLAVAAACVLAGAARLWADEPKLVEFEQAVRDAGITGIYPLADGLLLTNGEHSLRFNLGSRQILADGATVWLHAAPVLPYKATNGWQVAQDDLDSVLLPILAASNRPPEKLRVMLDAGHGGEDGGASSYDGEVVEKDFTLDLVCRLGALLEDAGMEVAYTREDDITLTLGERTKLAAATNADIFVSIHANTAGNMLAAGSETYVLPCAGQDATGASTLSTRARAGNTNDFCNNILAYSIHRRLPGRTRGRDRGVRRARYQVLRDAQCPAVLVECGFLSNTGDVKRLKSNWYRGKFAEAVKDGIVDYASRIPAPVEDAQDGETCKDEKKLDVGE